MAGPYLKASNPSVIPKRRIQLKTYVFEDERDTLKPQQLQETTISIPLLCLFCTLNFASFHSQIYRSKTYLKYVQWLKTSFFFRLFCSNNWHDFSKAEQKFISICLISVFFNFSWILETVKCSLLSCQQSFKHIAQQIKLMIALLEKT